MTSESATSQPSRYVRRVSPMERYALVIHEVHRYHVDGIVEGVGRIDAARLQAAVDRAAAANPAIRVRLRGFLGFARWRDSGVAPRVRELPLSDWDGNSERHAGFLDERLEPLRGGPVADLFLVPCRDGRTRIVFRQAHAAVDGRGCIHWMQEVFRALRGEPLQGSPSRLLDVEVQALNPPPEPAEPPPVPPPAPPACLPVLPPGQSGRLPLQYFWRRVMLNRNVPMLLTKTAVFMANRARRHGEGDVGFTIPVDFRGLRTQEMGLGNLTGYLRLPVPADASARSLMLKLARLVEERADCRRNPGLRWLPWLPISFLVRQLRGKIEQLLFSQTPMLPTGGIVSMGNLSTADYSCEGFAGECTYGVPGAVGKLNIIFTSYPDRICVSFCAPLAYNEQGQLDALIADYVAQFSAPGTPA